ncbi:hypothetical protein C8R47DRAFT_1150556 [Mycena vitilis]|nr:hypothetical protein C8R47DRAFT_1150556 [Mycena vitilis]
MRGERQRTLDGVPPQRHRSSCRALQSGGPLCAVRRPLRHFLSLPDGGREVCALATWIRAARDPLPDRYTDGTRYTSRFPLFLVLRSRALKLLLLVIPLIPHAIAHIRCPSCPTNHQGRTEECTREVRGPSPYSIFLSSSPHGLRRCLVHRTMGGSHGGDDFLFRKFVFFDEASFRWWGLLRQASTSVPRPLFTNVPGWSAASVRAEHSPALGSSASQLLRSSGVRPCLGAAVAWSYPWISMVLLLLELSRAGLNRYVYAYTWVPPAIIEPDISWGLMGGVRAIPVCTGAHWICRSAKRRFSTAEGGQGGHGHDRPCRYRQSRIGERLLPAYW